MKYKKWVLFFSFLLLLYSFCVFFNGKEISGIGYGQNKISYSNETNSFYFEQLDDTEKKVCNDIANLIANGNGGSLHLEEQISTYQYLRVLRTLSFDPEHQIWAIVLIFPVGENNKLIDRSVINDEKRITKLYIQVNDQRRREYLQNFKIILNDDNIIENIDELEQVCSTAVFSTKYYEEQSQRIEEYYNEIIDEMPDNIRERDAIQYFLNWIRDNIEYDYSIYQYDMEPYYEKLYENEIYSDFSNKSCIIENELYVGVSRLFYQNFAIEWA